MLRRTVIVRAAASSTGCCYTVLGLDPTQHHDITRKDVKKAFRTKAKKLHPDVGGDEIQYRVLREAYEEALHLRKPAASSTYYSTRSTPSSASNPTTGADFARGFNRREPPKDDSHKPNPSDFYDHPHSYHHPYAPEGASREGYYAHTDRRSTTGDPRQDPDSTPDFSWKWTSRTRDPTPDSDRQTPDTEPREHPDYGDATRAAHKQYYRESKDFESGFTEEEVRTARTKSRIAYGWYLGKKVCIFSAFGYALCCFEWGRVRETEEMRHRDGGYTGTKYGISDDDKERKASYWVPPRPSDNASSQAHKERVALMQGQPQFQQQQKSSATQSQGLPQALQGSSNVVAVGGYPYTPEGMAARRQDMINKRKYKAKATPFESIEVAATANGGVLLASDSDDEELECVD